MCRDLPKSEPRALIVFLPGPASLAGGLSGGLSGVTVTPIASLRQQMSPFEQHFRHLLAISARQKRVSELQEPVAMGSPLLI